MRIINRCVYLPTTKVISILQLLPYNYSSLDVDILLLSSRFQIIKYGFLYSKDLLNILSKVLFHRPYNIDGVFTYSGKVIVLTYMFNMSYQNEYRELSTLGCIRVLIHELRHAYQYQFIPYLKSFMLDKEYQSKVDHGEREEEKDAIEFTSKFMNDNLDRFIKIIEG